MRVIAVRTASVMLGLCLAAAGARGEDAEAAPIPPWGQHLDAEPKTRPLVRFPFESDGESTARVWATTEYVFSWIHSGRLPPLVTSGLTTDSRPGAIGNPYTTVSYGDAPLDYRDRSGFRVTVGGVVDEARGLSVEGSYLTLGGRTQGFTASSPGSPVIARPFFDVVNNVQDSSLTTYPGYFSGAIDIANTTYLQTEEINAFLGFRSTESSRIRGLAGFRHLRLRESLTVSEASTVTQSSSKNFGQTVRVNDFFETTNNFFGGQLGVTADCRWRRWTLEAFGKVALGTLEERVSVDGGTTFLGGTTPGGLLAVSSNIGSRTRDRFSAIPEAGVKLDAEIGRHLVASVGYSFLYIGDVVRPGNQVDLGINPNLVPTSSTFGSAGGPARPAPLQQESDYWAHLFTFGLTVRY